MSHYVLTLIPDLLAHGADLNLRNVYKHTSLELAQKWTRPDLFQLLQGSAKRGIPLPISLTGGLDRAFVL